MRITTKTIPVSTKRCRSISVSNRYRGISPVKAGPEVIAPDFLDYYTSTMCSKSSSCEPIIPDYYIQIAILHKMNMIMLQNNIDGFETQVFRLLLVGDMDTLAKLLEAIKSYHIAVHNIEIISRIVGLETP